MKVLSFDSSNEEMFKVMYEGLCLSQKDFNPRETRTIVRLFDKLDAVSEPTGEGLFRKISFVIGPTVSIELETEEFELLKAANECVRWNGLGARRAGQMLNWMDSIPNK